MSMPLYDIASQDAPAWPELLDIPSATSERTDSSRGLLSLCMCGRQLIETDDRGSIEVASEVDYAAASAT